MWQQKFDFILYVEQMRHNRAKCDLVSVITLQVLKLDKIQHIQFKWHHMSYYISIQLTCSVLQAKVSKPRKK